MTNPPVRLAWTDFVLDLRDFLIDKQVNTPLYIVGGAVRDAYLRGAIKDIDIAVDGDAIQIARQIADWFDGDIFVMDKERGVARVFVDTPDGQVSMDFARFRGDTLDDDLHDRDFTINAMAADLLGDVAVLIDPLSGEQDLNAKVLRRCSDHAIEDDPLRVLRAIRQSVQLKLKIHPDTLADVRQHVTGITQSSPERIRDEFFNILKQSMPSRAIRVLQHLGVLPIIIENTDKLIGLEQLPPHRFDAWNHTLLVMERLNLILTSISPRRTDNTAATFDLGMLVIQFDRYRAKLQAHLNREYGNGRTHQQLLILGALVHNLGKVEDVSDYVQASIVQAENVAESLRLTNHEQKALTVMISSYRTVLDKDEWDDLDLHRFWYSLGEGGIDATLLAVADYLGTYGAELEQLSWLQLVERVTILLDTYFNHYKDIVDPDMLLNGNDVMDILGLQGSPVVGEILTQLREAQVTGDVGSIEDARDFIQHTYDAIQADAD